MKYKCAIFDLDGTLLDTLQDLATAGNNVLKEHGYPVHPVEEYNYFVGDGVKTLIERITPEHCTEEDVQQCVRSFSDFYHDNWDETTGPYDGVFDMLQQLSKEGIRCSILSNKPHEFTTIVTERFFKDFSFDYVYGQRENVPKKPDPAGAVEIAKALNIDPAECLYIGDTSVDMKTGKGAGMFTIGVLWGFRKRDELEQNGADLIVEKPTEIVEYVLSA